MNEVFLMGKIITEIKFDFLLNNKKKSIARFYIEIFDKTKIKIIGYDGLADYCYRKLYKELWVFIYGTLNTDAVKVRLIKTL